MKKKIIFGIISFIIFSFILGSDVSVSEGRKSEEKLCRQLDIFIDAIEIVKKHYVKPIDDKKLIYGALKGMLFSLDPYSAFLEPELRKELEIETKGEFEGVGMEITLKDGIITVVSPIENTPAWKAGIKPGDKIIEIDGKPTKGMTTFEAAKKLRGKKGTKVTIGIMRKNVSKLIKITLTRDVIKIKSVKKKVINGIGYLRIREFQEKTPDEVAKVLKEFNSKDVKGLILDLRNNPGGLLSSAIEVADLFLPPDKLIVYTKGRKPEQISYFYGRKKALWKKPVVILANKGSASASEIVIGALKDNLKDVKLVGTKTFGKGSVQNVIRLKDGSAIKLTIAYYYTPKHLCIEGKGIKPDVEVKLPEEKVIIPASNEDVQFKKALEEMKKLLNS
ncbi:MAG TPA: S41 family peptidase [Firmicutes bacterium]|nr:S41 family peptidase [Bacillota bacterium]